MSLPATSLFVWSPGRTFAADFPAGFEAFTRAPGIDGLARIDCMQLDLHIITTVTLDHLTDFLALAQREFRCITVREFESHCQRDAYLGLDFVAAGAGLTWSREHQTRMDAWRQRPLGARWKESTNSEIKLQNEALESAMRMVEPLRRAA